MYFFNYLIIFISISQLQRNAIFCSRGSLRIYVPDAIPRVPHELREFMKMKQISEETPAELEAQKSYYREAVNELHYVPEIQLLERLSRALSENGTQLEILRPFHILCLNLLKISNVQIPTELRAQYDLDDETAVQHGRKKRCTSLRGDPYNNNCLGMCGPGCTCWWGVCFDCCFNRGCYEHDLCCGRDWDSDYCQEPWRYGWSCRSYGGYPRCL